MRRDIATNRLLLPFLTTNDLLKLSECCKTLIDYHHYLPTIAIIPQPPSTNPRASRRLLSQLLSQQQRETEVVRIHDPSAVVTVLEHRRFDGRPGKVKEPYFDISRLTDKHLGELGEAIEGVLVGVRDIIPPSYEWSIEHFRRMISLLQRAGDRAPSLRTNHWNTSPDSVEGVKAIVTTTMRDHPGVFRHLEELQLSSQQIGVDGVAQVLSYLPEGSCSHLRKLSLSSFEGGGPAPIPVIEALATALQSDYMGNMEHLRVVVVSGQLQLTPILFALAYGSCRNLKSLMILPLHNTSLADRNALITAITSGAIPLLESLCMALSGSDDPDSNFYVPLIESFQGGGECFKIKEFDCPNRAADLEAFAHGVRSGWFPHLQVLQHGHSLTILQAIRDGACPDLRKINVDAGNTMAITREHAHVLGEALASKTLMKLESLRLLSWPGDDEWLVEVMEGLKGGGEEAVCHHKKLKRLSVFNSGLGPMGAAVLAEDITYVPLYHLEHFEISGNAAIGDDVVVLVIEALATTCPHLQELDVSCTGMGHKAGNALHDAIGRGAWPDLTCVSARDNDFLDTITGGGCQRLHNLLKMGACPKLCEIRVDSKFHPLVIAALKARWRPV